MRTFIELLSILISVVAGDAWGNTIQYTVTDLGNLGGSDGAIAKAINNSGEVIGYGYLSGNTYYHAFIYSGGTMHDIGTGGIDSYAEGINDAGQVVGYASDLPGGGTVHGFLYSGGSMQNLGKFGRKTVSPLASTTGDRS